MRIDKENEQLLMIMKFIIHKNNHELLIAHHDYYMHLMYADLFRFKDLNYLKLVKYF